MKFYRKAPHNLLKARRLRLARDLFATLWLSGDNNLPSCFIHIGLSLNYIRPCHSDKADCPHDSRLHRHVHRHPLVSHPGHHISGIQSPLTRPPGRARQPPPPSLPKRRCPTLSFYPCLDARIPPKARGYWRLRQTALGIRKSSGILVILPKTEEEAWAQREKIAGHLATACYLL